MTFKDVSALVPEQEGPKGSYVTGVGQKAQALSWLIKHGPRAWAVSRPPSQVWAPDTAPQPPSPRHSTFMDWTAVEVTVEGHRIQKMPHVVFGPLLEEGPIQKLPFSPPHGKGASPLHGSPGEQHTSLLKVAALRASWGDQ
ncbi:hypothetical protein CB1_000713010 [Camelus ferus]|nr:hypothetical protein CB1_000713010 [Camelus ferus]